MAMKSTTQVILDTNLWIYLSQEETPPDVEEALSAAGLPRASRDRVIAADPSDGVTLPRKRRAEHAMTIPTPHQVGRIVTAAEEWFRPFIGSCAFAGLRLGEAAAVKIDDIDFMRRTLTVSRQVQRRAGHSLEIRAPKYNSERVIYLPDDLVTMLSEYVRNFGVRPQGWLFVGMDGAPPHSNTIGRWWRRALKDAGLQPPPADKAKSKRQSAAFHLHDLRHFYASGLIAQGCDVVSPSSGRWGTPLRRPR